MKSPLKHSVALNQGIAHYLIFDSVSDFHDFVDAQMEELNGYTARVFKKIRNNALDRITNESNWYGSPPPKSIKELNFHTQFIGMHLVQSVELKIRKHLTHYIQFVKDQILPKPKLSYNDKGLGVFAFDRAAMGLFKTQPTAADPKIQKNINQMKIELDRDNKTTSIKEVYAYIKDKNTSIPSLQLYISVGGNAGIMGDQLLYVGLACAILVEYMELRGIAVEVNIILGTFFNNSYPVGIIRLKRFEAPLDKNMLLLLSSDPRYFRYRGFKGLIALSNYFELPIPYDLGMLKDDIGKSFVEALDSDGIVFEQSYDIHSVVQEVIRIITTYNQKLKNR
ncbi:hypothetical protein HN014_10605 [Aquimarina sp. TRL1]|uniref:hypothetical protein n=1 Tax=Aquimarina sp. (strain TRL1) TaxID=2736252 RepID=UPI00158CB36D|nr:hypothetical protein [Aquimarina sp. TRL1]QKX05347.1 hypothetical protein HN014_10605 [Aquimarina sp. TRL1]